MAATKWRPRVIRFGTLRDAAGATLSGSLYLDKLSRNARLSSRSMITWAREPFEGVVEARPIVIDLVDTQ
jgi:hypothetical protein